MGGAIINPRCVDHIFEPSALPDVFDLVGRKAIEIADTAGAYQIVLTAAFTGMGRIPGYVTAGGAAIGTIRVTKLNGAIAAACVVLAGMIGGVSVGSTVWFRTGDDVVLVRRSANAVDLRTFFGKVGGAVDVVAKLAEFDRVAVQMSHVVGHDGTVGIGPRSIADAVARVDGGLVASSLSA